MNTTKETEQTQDVHAPRNLSAAENAILTIKVLAGFGILGGAIWAIKSWASGG